MNNLPFGIVSMATINDN